MKTLVVLLLCCLPTYAQKMHVKVLTHTVDGRNYTRVVPGAVVGSGNANSNCGSYGNSVNCSAEGSGNSVSLPAHTQGETLAHIQMMLLLPDGRRVGVYCNDKDVGELRVRIHACKNPETDELEADFSGKNVKLTWGVGLDGKKK